MTCTIIGATGLVGRHILKLAYSDSAFDKIRVVSRRPLSYDDAKVEVRVIDFADEVQFREAIRNSDVVFCAVGTTNAKVGGDKDAYRKIDYDIPVNAARYASETGCKNFLLVSAIGADSKSKIFYSRLKGEVEEEVSRAGIPSVSIFQPSMLLGDRDEFRMGEKVGKVVMKALSFLTPSKYKAIEASDVAKAMVEVSKQQDIGVRTFRYREMMSLA